jgi:hypothetical protein
MTLAPDADRATTYEPPIKHAALAYAPHHGHCPICNRLLHHELVARLNDAQRWTCTKCLADILPGISRQRLIQWLAVEGAA